MSNETIRPGMLGRRRMLGWLAASAGALAGGPGYAADKRFEIELTEAQWLRRLSPAQFAVLRDPDTEKPGSSLLDREKRRGTYACAGCDLPLFASSTKFDSGTGWPSFYRPLQGAVGTRQDRSWLLMLRTEVHCRRCGGHLGHVFDDGPPPTGLRYCMNGAAMKFAPAGRA